MEKLAATCATAVESRVQIDGRIVTSRGPGTTIEFSITLIEQLYGKDKADEVSSILVCFVSASFINRASIPEPGNGHGSWCSNLFCHLLLDLPGLLLKSAGSS